MCARSSPERVFTLCTNSRGHMQICMRRARIKCNVWFGGTISCICAAHEGISRIARAELSGCMPCLLFADSVRTTGADILWNVCTLHNHQLSANRMNIFIKVAHAQRRLRTHAHAFASACEWALWWWWWWWWRVMDFDLFDRCRWSRCLLSILDTVHSTVSVRVHKSGEWGGTYVEHI